MTGTDPAMPGDVAALLAAHYESPECRTTHGALLDLLMETYECSRHAARKKKKDMMRRAHGVPGASNARARRDAT